MLHYTLSTCSLEVAAPVEVGRAAGHFWFSTLHPFDHQHLLCEVVVTADQAQGKWPAVLYGSQDGGVSWEKVCEITSYGPSSTLLGPRQLLLMPYEVWPRSSGDQRSATADGSIITWDKRGKITVKPIPVTFVGFPRDLAPYHEGELSLLTNGNIFPLHDGRLFTTLYGKFVGDAKDRVFAVVSSDQGRTWRFHGIVASGQEVPDAYEGANESNAVRLADGRLMCVYRVGSGRHQPYHQSYSADEGVTWTPPRRMADVWSVEPQLVRLDNGLILLSGGRSGLFLWVCADGEGQQWEPFNLAEHHNAQVSDPALHYIEGFCKAVENVESAQSTSYTGMRVVGPDEVLLCYDRLANGWIGPPGPWGEADVVFCVRVKATPL